jgi:hypothetical protein
MALDPEVHAYRRDLADIALAGQLFAPHYARPMMRAAGPSARAVFDRPSLDAQVVTTLEPGEDFALLEISGEWAWGYRRRDHRVGYVPVGDLAPIDPAR